MDYSAFYDIAEYGNKAWKGSFSPKEVAENAYDYLCEYERSKGNLVSGVMWELMKLLAEDGGEECKGWLYDLATEFNLISMSYTDFSRDVILEFIKQEV